MTNPPMDHLPPYRVRPRFEVLAPMPPAEAVQRLRNSLKQEGAAVKGKVITGFATLYLPRDEQHYWSPQLTISIEDVEDKNGCLVRGLYGPRASVWTMFVFFYAAIGFFTMVVLLWGLTNHTLGKSVWILWWIPVLVLVFLTLYLVAYFGQRLGHDQMLTLHQFVEKSLGLEIV